MDVLRSNMAIDGLSALKCTNVVRGFGDTIEALEIPDVQLATRSYFMRSESGAPGRLVPSAQLSSPLIAYPKASDVPSTDTGVQGVVHRTSVTGTAFDARS